MSFVNILMSVPDSAVTMTNILQLKANPINQVDDENLDKLIGDMIDGSQVSYTKISTGAVQASGTGTFTGAATAGETMTIAGVTFTASATPDESANQYLVSATVSLEAASLSRAINASTTASPLVFATASAGVVTITAVSPGITGNFIPTVDVNTSNFTFAQALLTGGSNGTEARINYGAAS
jgi:hypothetical protein